MASYEKRQNKWCVRFRVVEAGRYVNKRLSGFDRKKDAENAYHDYLLTANPAKHKSGDMTFLELYNDYVKHIQSRLKGSTIVDKDYAIQKHILPTFADKKMSRITKLDLLQWQRTIEHFSYKYKNNLRAHFSAVWNYGVMYFDIAPNLFKSIEPFSKPKEFITFFSIKTI